MKTFLHQCISIFLACCIPLQAASGLEQENTSGAVSGTQVKQVSAQEISKDTLISKFQELQQQSQAIQLLDSKLRSLQFSPATDPGRYWGQTATFEGTVQGSTQSVVGTFYIHDYVNQNSKDGVALGQVTLTSSSGASKTYAFYLVAPNGDPTKAQEYAVVNNEVTLQHSVFTCVQGQLPSVGATCATAAVTCIKTAFVTASTGVGTVFSWAAYAGCVALACGIAFVKAFLCCECNGDIWCKYIVGSCSQGPTPWVNNDLSQLSGAPSAPSENALDGYQTSNGNEHVNYIGADNHVYELIYTGKWANNDLTKASGAPSAAPRSALNGYQTSNGNQHVNYVSTDNHVHELVYTSKWAHNDLTQLSGAPSAASGTALKGYQTSNGNEHVNYVGTNNHVYELVYTGKWAHNDLTQLSGAPSAAPSALEGYQTSNGNEHVNYVGTDNHVYELVYTGKWAHNDLTQLSGAPSAASGSALDGYQTSNGKEHVNYIGTDNHVYELIYTSKWANNDLTKASGAPSASSGSALDGYQTSNGNEHVNYIGADNHVYELIYTGKWANNDLTKASGAPSTASGSALKGYQTSNGNEHVNYIGTNNHVYELVYQ
ncbi:MAG: hypothetical protein ABSB66_08305 [Candidatus Acidiferrales bacterium]|jgi:hypothetical protein